jgi:hypothetical protein
VRFGMEVRSSDNSLGVIYRGDAPAIMFTLFENFSINDLRNRRKTACNFPVFTATGAIEFFR